MITPKVNALFQFIEFLHSNIENFKQYDSIVNELHELYKKRNRLKPWANYKDKAEADWLNDIIPPKLDLIDRNIVDVIKAKAVELDIFDPVTDSTIWNWNVKGISELKETFGASDLPTIQEHKAKYIEFRERTGSHYFEPLLFFRFDEMFEYLFEFFTDGDQSGFESFRVNRVTIPTTSHRAPAEGSHTPAGLPKFTEAGKEIFDYIKDFFNPVDQAVLMQLINEPGMRLNKKLLFAGQGNILTDCFRKLIDNRLIICEKQKLENWIVSNFEFLKNDSPATYKPDTVTKAISRDGFPCKKPLIEIFEGKIQKKLLLL